jgi:hypothetical protein
MRWIMCICKETTSLQCLNVLSSFGTLLRLQRLISVILIYPITSCSHNRVLNPDKKSKTSVM